MKKFFGHFFTITKHRHEVFKNCIKAGIFFQGLFHDLSKYSFQEFIPGVKYFTGKKSPNELERAKYGYSSAWLHHKGRNKHHFEYWVDLDPVTKIYSPVKMPLKYVKEMFCDRVAACKVYLKKNYHDGAAYDYFNTRTRENKMHKDTMILLEYLLLMLRDKGEKETFEYIRNLKAY